MTEGAKAASAAASKLPADDYDVIGFVLLLQDSKTVKTITALTKGRSCIVWPDDDLPGAKVAHAAVLARPGPVGLGRARPLTLRCSG